MSEVQRGTDDSRLEAPVSFLPTTIIEKSNVLFFCRYHAGYVSDARFQRVGMGILARL